MTKYVIINLVLNTFFVLPKYEHTFFQGRYSYVMLTQYGDQLFKDK